MRFAWLILLLACSSIYAQNTFVRGYDVITVFNRPLTSAIGGFPIEPTGIKYELEIADSTDFQGWFRFSPPNFYQSFDQVSLSKRTDGLMVGHVYQHRVRAIVDPPQLVETPEDTVLILGVSEWSYSPTYVLYDSIPPVVTMPETLRITPGNVREILIIQDRE